MTAKSASSARRALVQDRPHILRVRAPPRFVRVTLPSLPQHDARKSRVRLVLADHALQLLGTDVVLAAALGPRRRGRTGRQPDVQLRTFTSPLVHLLIPLIEVKRLLVTLRILIRRATRVVVELDEQLVKLGLLDHIAHVGLGDRALRRARDGVFVLRVLREQLPQLADHGGHLAARVALDVDVEAVDELLAKRAALAATARAWSPERAEQGRRCALGLLLRAHLHVAGGAADGDVDFLALLLALGDGRFELGAGLAVAEGARAADLTFDAVGNAGDERKDDGVDAFGVGAVG